MKIEIAIKDSAYKGKICIKKRQGGKRCVM